LIDRTPALAAHRSHFHDLRREAGSRWDEGGFQLHEARDPLGHANVSQTDTYLSVKIAGRRESMKRFDARDPLH
jgi:integrase